MAHLPGNFNLGTLTQQNELISCAQTHGIPGCTMITHKIPGRTIMPPSHDSWTLYSDIA